MWNIRTATAVCLLAGACAFSAYGQAGNSGSLTQLLEQAPPEVEQALRNRVNDFYQLHVEGKFRQAETMVCEDSKDAFYAADKQKYRSREILKIAYDDPGKYTQARAVVSVGTSMMIAGQLLQVNIPLTTFWRIENGQWCWYVVARKGPVETPWGYMNSAPAPESRSGPPQPPSGKRPTAEDILTKVVIDRPVVHVRSYEASSDNVTVTNYLEGTVKLTLQRVPVKGLDLRLNREELRQGEAAILAVFFDPGSDKRARPPAKTVIRVAPTGQEIPIEVRFALPPDYVKGMEGKK